MASQAVVEVLSMTDRNAKKYLNIPTNVRCPNHKCLLDTLPAAESFTAAPEPAAILT